MSRPCPSNAQATAMALHALEPGEELAVRTHVLHCASCQEVIKETELVMAGLAASVEQVDPPPRLRDNIVAFAAVTPQVAPPAEDEGAAPPELRSIGGRQSTSRRRRRVAVALVAAAVLGFGGLGAYTARLAAERDAAVAQAQRIAEAVQPGAARAVLRTPDGTPVAAVYVGDGTRTVVTAGLAPNDAAATIYTVWGIAGDTPHPIGTFDVASTGTDTHAVGPAGEPYQAYAISLEPGRTAPAVPTTVVASGPVEAS